ncbi:UbiA family prenyltransferase [Methanomicrobium antiquum]|uniref:UbiA family prenyltransferase n=1 Tax=Methanomicrobium antiquum TaxID=487686 RepID=A0AAF0FQW0_9EURY|nr:UbiA family prenyltransferase [Methanomicrobium antiquum]WFN37912.1 UbiA family prenyltransferase [Methanomicrobium antiquum]
MQSKSTGFLRNSPNIRAYSDLLRLHFAIIWPLLFCSGTMLAFTTYGFFSWTYLIIAALIGLFGFEAGMVLNDYVDRFYDTKDIENSMTNYWRPFKTRPVAMGLIPARNGLILFVLLALTAFFLSLLLPFPHSLFVILIMVYCNTVEVFYQVKKRNQKFPVAQLVGRTDLALFLVAGYLVAGMPDFTAFICFLFLYTYAIGHLVVNDLADLKNDFARGMKTIPVLYGVKKAVIWVIVCTVLNGITIIFLASFLGLLSQAGLIFGFIFLLIANLIIIRGKGKGEKEREGEVKEKAKAIAIAKSAMKALPLFHVAMFVYSLSLLFSFV